MSTSSNILTRRLYWSARKGIKPGRSKSKWIFFGMSTASFMAYGYSRYQNNLLEAKRHPTELCPEYFTKYKISNKLKTDDSHFILELQPLKPQSKNTWSSLGNHNLWSVEVKQPELMVVRNYTPLPVKFKKHSNNQTNKPCTLVPLSNHDTNNGEFILFIKSYDNGEVARWIKSLPINKTIEIRGPFVEYQIAPETENINFYTAGTGIVSPLQLILNNYSHFQQTVNIFHSCNHVEELGPLKDLLLSKVNNKGKDNVTLKLFEDSKLQNISINKNKNKFINLVPTYNPRERNISLVCGPERYIEYIAGKKFDPLQGPVAGILAKKGWSNQNVYKLS